MKYMILFFLLISLNSFATCSDYALLKDSIIEHASSSLNHDLIANEQQFHGQLLRCHDNECRLMTEVNFQLKRAEIYKNSNDYITEQYSNLADLCKNQ